VTTGLDRKGLAERRNSPGQETFHDFVPPLLEKKYLKTIINCHRCAQTLGRGDWDGDGVVTVLDVDFILRQK
jgi:hypothetical protein